MTGNSSTRALSHSNASYCALKAATPLVSKATPFLGGPGQALEL